MYSTNKQITDKDAAELAEMLCPGQSAPHLSAQSQDTYADLEELFGVATAKPTTFKTTTADNPIVIPDSGSDTESVDSFKSTEENDPTANARLDVIECLTWAMNLEFREDVDPKMIEGMKRNAENLTGNDRQTFNDCLCNYMTQHAIWKDMGRFTPLLSEATHETLALVTEEIHLLYGRIKNDPKSLFFGMQREKNDFLCAYNAWKAYVPKAKKAKHNGPSSSPSFSPSFSRSFTSDYASEDQMAQVFAMSRAEEMEHNQQVSDEAGILHKKLDEGGLLEVEVPPVGNCVFETMTKQADVLLGIHISPQEMRKGVVKYIETHPREFAGSLMAEMVEDPGLCGLIGVQPDAAPEEKWKAYLEYMGEEGHYGGPLEVRAFAIMYGCTATVVSADTPDLVFKPKSELQTPHVAYFVFYKTGRHYNPAYLFH